jgi:hypothetical protein
VAPSLVIIWWFKEREISCSVLREFRMEVLMAFRSLKAKEEDTPYVDLHIQLRRTSVQEETVCRVHQVTSESL